VKREDQVGYRADRCDETGSVTALAGNFRALRPATAAVHSPVLRSHVSVGAPDGTGIIQAHGLNQSAVSGAKRGAIAVNRLTIM
jgi:hypothetical protein